MPNLLFVLSCFRGRATCIVARLALLATSAHVSTGQPDTPSANVEQPAPHDLAKSITLEFGNTVTMKLNLIRAGKFTMGSPASEVGRRDDETQHEVTLTQPFYLAQTLVTQEQYEALIGRNPSRVTRGRTFAVDSVSWDDAVAFCQKLSQKTGQPVVLPTEAQWEYACRAGTQTRFFHGDDEKRLGQYALFWARTNLPVAQFKPNAWDLHDMLGNLHQWCADRYASHDDKPQTDPTGLPDGKERVLRGGCFHNSAKFCRCASRIHYSAAQADYDFGFRVAVTVH